MAWRSGPTRRAFPVAIALLTLGGCSTQQREPLVYERSELAPGGQGTREIRATYRGGVLKAALPHEVRPEAVLIAARAALIHRGYTITEDSATTGLGRVCAEPPPGSREWHWPRWVKVSAAVTSAGSRVDVQIRPQDDVLSAAILDDTLRRLGR